LILDNAIVTHMEGLPGFIFPGALFISCGFINHIKISAHSNFHARHHPQNSNYISN
jgi:hypothetical protein